MEKGKTMALGEQGQSRGVQLELGITPEEWERLPMRARLLLNAGFVDGEECIKGWRDHWKREDVSYFDELELERRLGN